jgi:hypothetical protein
MTPVVLGVVGGLAFGIVDVLLMLPMQFPDKRTALLISIPDAVITKAYVPILASGVAGGALLGWIAGRVVP